MTLGDCCPTVSNAVTKAKDSDGYDSLIRLLYKLVECPYCGTEMPWTRWERRPWEWKREVMRKKS